MSSEPAGLLAARIRASRLFNRATLKQVLVLAQIVDDNAPITVRGAFYRAVSAGVYPDTSDAYYRQCGRLLLKLRRAGFVDYRMIVDSTRRRLKPPSWSGLSDYASDVSEWYRKDLWSRQATYIEVFVEKDAMAAVIEPVTREYDIYLNVIRGSVSETFVWGIAEQWREIEKPIVAYYLGDHDPSGLSIETDLHKRLSAFSEKSVFWERLAITEEDFGDESILGFQIKGNRHGKAWQTRHSGYLERFGDRCVEVDALPPDVIRSRIRDAIEAHIEQDEWERLKTTEELERDTFRTFMSAQIQ